MLEARLETLDKTELRALAQQLIGQIGQMSERHAAEVRLKQVTIDKLTYELFQF